MASKRRWRSSIAVLFTAVLTACTTAQLRIPQPNSPYLNGETVVIADGDVIDLASCAKLFVDLEAALQAGQLQDVQTQRIAGFPYLRTDRHYASYRNELQDYEQLVFWAEQLRQLDMQARRHELARLDTSIVATVYGDSVEESLDVCGAALLSADLVNQRRVDELLALVNVPDSYSSLARALGVYPVSRWFVSSGVTRLQRGIRERFVDGSSGAWSDLIRYTPTDNTLLNTDAITDIISASRGNPLGIPLFTDEHSRRLFAHFSPVLEIQTWTDDDRLGSPFRTDARTVAVNTADPVVYHMLSYARMDGEVLPQLNYIFWFPARPRQGAFDLLGGHLDGITLRVTLGSDGTPIMYDAMHNCGCYHMYFPVTRRVRPSQAAFEADEPLLIPKAVNMSASDRLLVRIEAISHYITELSNAVPAEELHSVVYRMADYDELRTLALPDGRQRSLFGHDGLVPGSTRRERWVLWPMGVLEPGAMRQWGHHATAFVGRRHFDDPFLLERYFVME